MQDYEAPEVLASYGDDELVAEAAVCEGYGIEIIVRG
jgi:hypothetical protein